MKQTETRADHGAAGPAMLSRPKRIIETQVHIGDRTDAIQYEDSTLADRMFNDGRLGPVEGENANARHRRLEAAEWLLKVHRAAFPPKTVVASYGQATGGEGYPVEFPDPDAPNFKLTDAVMWNRRVLRDTERAIGIARLYRLRSFIGDRLTVPANVICDDLDMLARHRGIG